MEVEHIYNSRISLRLEVIKAKGVTALNDRGMLKRALELVSVSQASPQPVPVTEPERLIVLMVNNMQLSDKTWLAVWLINSLSKKYVIQFC